MKNLVIKALANIAKAKIKKYHPTVVAVTGSVGKTSTRSAIAIALGAKYRVRTPYKNYNNEIGLPLAVLGEQSPGKNAWEWLKLFTRAVRSKDMPEYLVLEYGVDKPGDMAGLIRIAHPQTVVITAISPVHVSNYPSLEALIDEKAALGEAVLQDGLVLLNGDDVRVMGMRKRFHAPVRTYSLSNGDAYATDIQFTYPKEESFDVGEVFVVTKATLHVGNETAELELLNCATVSMVSAALAAVQVAVHHGVPLVTATAALSKELVPVNGRLRPLAGIKGSLILDDSYNAAPASVIAGLEALEQFTPGELKDRRIAALADMAELGSLSEAEHRMIGERVATAADLFVAVGPQMKFAIEAAIAAGMPEDKTIWFKDSVEAGRYLDRILETGDVVLVKGSQSQRMERLVKDILAEPGKATELLVRQEDRWLA
ncbi:MAG: Alanine racemase [Patescibacteria group bacterium]|nr:Alanine racemase [Patescibacteria group bacterium]